MSIPVLRAAMRRSKIMPRDDVKRGRFFHRPFDGWPRRFGRGRRGRRESRERRSKALFLVSAITDEQLDRASLYFQS